MSSQSNSFHGMTSLVHRTGIEDWDMSNILNAGGI